MNETRTAPQVRSIAWRIGRRVARSNGTLFLAGITALNWYRQRFRGAKKPWTAFYYTREMRELLEGCSVVYMAFPYYTRPALFGVPSVATFHDLHFRHFPGAYDPETRRLLDRQTSRWTRIIDECVVSSRFIEGDLLRHYPHTTGKTRVVYLAPYGIREIETSVLEHVLESQDLARGRYFIYSGGTSRHKNIINVLRAVDLLKRAGHPVPLVITGSGTQAIGDFALELAEGNPVAEINDFLRQSSLVLGEDVRVLGYVSNEEVDALTRGAAAIVHASLYEAGCGPAMDAWLNGVPVAFSNIPPYLEQLERLDVHAWLFDPLDPEDIARALGAILRSPEEAARLARRSQAAIKSYTWDDTAVAYQAAFASAIERFGSRVKTHRA